MSSFKSSNSSFLEIVLSKFAEEGIKLVDGIDPSEASSALAKKLYNLNTKVGCFENFRVGDKKFELLI